MAHSGVPVAVFTAQTFFDSGEENRMIELQNVNVRLTGFALQDVSLRVEKGEFFSLLGPTGAGKTLVLESIVGLVTLSGGRIRIGGRDVTRLPPEKRGVGIVYQDHALFPHLSVRENITFGVRYHRKSEAISPGSLDLLVNRLGLAHLLNRSVENLSGGEKQRVALARALAVDPTVLLLDEPLSSLDPNFRAEIRQLLKDLHRQTGISVLMVTHDFSEAHFLAQRVAVFNAGHLEQVGKVADVFQRPATPFVAEFVGMKNIFPASFGNGRAQIDKLSFQIKVPNCGHTCIAIRPEHIQLFTALPECRPTNFQEAVIARIDNHGVYFDVLLTASGLQFQSFLPTSQVHQMTLVPGQCVFMNVAPEDIHLV
jgi:molybdate/tungstate transport system ATP-binding protein